MQRNSLNSSLRSLTHWSGYEAPLHGTTGRSMGVGMGILIQTKRSDVPMIPGRIESDLHLNGSIFHTTHHPSWAAVMPVTHNPRNAGARNIPPTPLAHR